MPENLIEGLVALIFFVVLPLLQWLRERTARPPQGEVPGEVRRRVPPRPRPAPPVERPRGPAERPGVPVPEPAPTPRQRRRIEPAPRPPVRHELPAGERPVPVMLPPEGPVAPVRPAPIALSPRALRRRALVRALHDRQTVRRAMVFATILGPCRANDAGS